MTDYNQIYTTHSVPRDELKTICLYVSIKEHSDLIKELTTKLDGLKDRILYLENTFLPVPDEHEILYEKVYQSNPLLNHEPPNPTLTISPTAPDSKASNVFKVAGS